MEDGNKTAVITTVGQEVLPLYQTFLQQFPEWASRLGSHEPVYCIPDPAIKKLSIARRRRKALLPAAEVGAELAFTRLCKSINTLGFWNSKPIVFPLSTDSEVTPPDEWLKQFSSDQIFALKTTAELMRTMRRRKRGVLGWLLTDPSFLGEAEELKGRWSSFPLRLRPSLIRRPIRLPAPLADGEVAEPRIDGFCRDLSAFLDKWGLTQMVTWDLPEPQGPLLPNLLPPGAEAHPTHGVHVFIPIHYHIQQNDSLIRQIEQFQQQKAQEVGVPRGFAGLPHSEAFARIFEVLHIERSITSRLSGGAIPYGEVSTVVNAIAKGVGVGLFVVRRARKAISACREGRRDKITWLKPRVR